MAGRSVAVARRDRCTAGHKREAEYTNAVGDAPRPGPTSPRRRPGSRAALRPVVDSELDSGLRRNDERGCRRDGRVRETASAGGGAGPAHAMRGLPPPRGLIVAGDEAFAGAESAPVAAGGGGGPGCTRGS